MCLWLFSAPLVASSLSIVVMLHDRLAMNASSYFCRSAGAITDLSWRGWRFICSLLSVSDQALAGDDHTLHFCGFQNHDRCSVFSFCLMGQFFLRLLNLGRSPKSLHGRIYGNSCHPANTDKAPLFGLQALKYMSHTRTHTLRFKDHFSRWTWVSWLPS